MPDGDIYWNNRDYYKQQNLKYYYEHKEERLAYNREYYERNKELISEYAKRCRRENPDRYHEYLRYRNRTVSYIKYREEWMSKNHDKYLQYLKNWRLRKKIFGMFK